MKKHFHTQENLGRVEPLESRLLNISKKVQILTIFLEMLPLQLVTVFSYYKGLFHNNLGGNHIRWVAWSTVTNTSARRLKWPSSDGTRPNFEPTKTIVSPKGYFFNST